MRKLILTAFLVVGAITMQAQEIKWLSFEEAMELNEKSPKPIIIDIYTDWCGWCKKMDKTTYKNKEIVNYINANYYPIKLDGEEKNDISFKGKNFTFKAPPPGTRGKGYHELAAAIMKGKMSYPSTAFLNKEKQLIQNVPGYLTEQRLEKILAYFNNDTYKTTKWAEFEKSFKSAL